MRTFTPLGRVLLLVAFVTGVISDGYADAPARKSRFILDHDGHGLFSTMTANYRADVDETVDDLPANVTTFMLCCGAGRFYYPTKLALTDPRLKQLAIEHAKGNDPFGYFLERVHASGRETFITFRMNDAHNPTDADGWNTPLVRVQHPDAIASPAAAARGDNEWMNWCLDYSRPEVSEYVRGLLHEVVEKYAANMHGLQLDWMRFPHHLSGTPEEVWAKRGDLTQIVEAARNFTAAHHLLLAVRVPSTPAGCRTLGIDLEEWARRGLIDFMVASPFLDTDYEMPVAAFRKMVGPALPIYACADIEHGWQTHCPESLRATATSLYGCGADGISLFNFAGMRSWPAVSPYEWLAGLESPATAARKPLLFSVPEMRYRKWMDQPGLVPAHIPAHSHVTLPLPLPAAALPTKRVRLLVVSDGDARASVNASAVEYMPSVRPTELFFEPIRANDVHRPTREQSHLYRVQPGQLRAGENVLELSNDTDQPIAVTRVNLGLW